MQIHTVARYSVIPSHAPHVRSELVVGSCFTNRTPSHWVSAAHCVRFAMEYVTFRTQAAHVAVFGVLAALPAGQTAQPRFVVGVRDCATYSPTGQTRASSHAVLPGWPCHSEGAQGVQLVCPGVGCTLPGSHALHVDVPDALVWYVPTGHSSHWRLDEREGPWVCRQPAAHAGRTDLHVLSISLSW